MKNIFNIRSSILIKFCLLGTALFIEQIGIYGLFIWIARKYGPLEYSSFTTALVLTKVAFGATEMGLQPVVTRELANKTPRSAETVHSAIVIRLITTLLTAFGVTLVVNWIGYPNSVKTGVMVFSIYMVLLHLSNLNLAVLRGKELQNSMAVIMIAGSVSTVLAASFFILSGSDLFYVQAAFILGAFVQVFSGFYHQKRIFYRFRCDFANCAELLKRSLPFGLVAISSFIYFRIDEVMISFFFPETDYVGIYDAAYTIFYAIAFIPMILHHIFLPMFSRLRLESLSILKKRYHLLLIFVLVYSACLCTGIYLFSEPLVLFIYGETYIESVLALKLLMFGGVFLALSFVLITALMAVDKGMILLKIVGSCAILNMVLNLVVIPYYGYLGAAVTTIVTEAFLAILGICFMNHYFKTELQQDSRSI